jgi:hypothetical protein
MWLVDLGRAWGNSSEFWVLRKKNKMLPKEWEVTNIGNNLTFTSLGLGQIMIT